MEEVVLSLVLLYIIVMVLVGGVSQVLLLPQHNGQR